jgi:hypothetical protein
VKYLLSIYVDESQFEGRTEEEGRAAMELWDAYTTETKNAGAFVAGEGLQPTATATTVRGVDGKPRVTDGPFAETKEQLGGFYMLECKDIDEAIEWAGKIPSIAFGGSVEVRPVMDYDAAGSEEHSATAGANA